MKIPPEVRNYWGIWLVFLFLAFMFGLWIFTLVYYGS